MKKRVIALSVAAALGGIGGAASAQVFTTEMQFSGRSTGQVLIVPYFTTQQGNMTLLNIVNTDTVNGKAVKIRFRGASNSDDLYDFQLFLSPGDVWAANIAAPFGISRLQTADRSCTLPAGVGTALQEFITTRLNPALSGDALNNETREGYIEILTMANIPPAVGTGTIFVATKHNSAGTAPCTASVLEGITRFDTRLDAPTIGLMANWTIINVPQTTTWSSEAIALRATNSAGVAGPGRNVFFPQIADFLSPADVALYTADPLFKDETVHAASYDLPDLSTPYAVDFTGNPQEQANSLSEAIASTRVGIEFLTDPAINASTDWIVSNPFRRYYVAVDYTGSLSGGPVIVTNFEDHDDPEAVYYRKTDSGTAWSRNVVLRGFQACALVDGISFYSREEQNVQATNIVISPGTPVAAPELCGEIAALGINSGSTASPSPTIFASVARSNIDVTGGFRDGWGIKTATNSVNGVALGLPQITQQFVRAFNASASAGFSGTFAARWDARSLQAGGSWVSAVD